MRKRPNYQLMTTDCTDCTDKNPIRIRVIREIRGQNLAQAGVHYGLPSPFFA